MTVTIDILERINRRALAQMVAMIWRANHRDDQQPGDPKVGGHPASCASALEIHSALHMLVREPQDFFCSKPHAAPLDHALFHQIGLFRHKDGRWFDDGEAEAVMDELRAFSRDGRPVFQSYHAEADPDFWRILPTGTVGIPPVNAIYLSLAFRYARTHGWDDLEDPHFWCVIGDSEFREGSLLEVMPEAAERELGNVTWIIDYNRQSLDGSRTPNLRGLEGTDADRIEGTGDANGWEVIHLRHGSYRLELFEREGGEALRRALEEQLSDFRLQTLLWKNDGKLMRETLIAVAPDTRQLVDTLSDQELRRVFLDVGGHDLRQLHDAMVASKQDSLRPTLIIAHTIKGHRLASQAATGNHSKIPDEDEVKALLEAEGLSMERPYERIDPDTPEGRFLAEHGAYWRDTMESLEVEAKVRYAAVLEAIDATGGVCETLNINLKLAPMAHTQWMWGQLAAKLVRIGVHDDLVHAGKPAGKTLTEEEERWVPIADLMATLSPDVGTSTNINPAMDQKVFGPDSELDWEAELELRERMRPSVAPNDESWSRHIRFDIAEANCMSATGSFGKMGQFVGAPLVPMMTVYDFFIKRALDQLYYNLYWGSSFILVGTPSGVTLAPEGAQHSWKSDIQMPNLITWEPSFAQEMDWILCDAICRHVNRKTEGRNGVLIRAVTLGLQQSMLIENLRKQARYKQGIPEGAELAAQSGDGGLPEAEVPSIPDAEIMASLRDDVLLGGYKLIDWRGYRGYEPGENVVRIVTMGGLVHEAVKASAQLLERGIYADVIVASSPELLCGILGERSGYAHLREGLGIDGDLHLGPRGQGDQPLDSLDVVDLAGRRVPIVSVHDGEAGLLDNLGSIVGVKQIALAVRKFSKSGTPADVFGYHHLDAASIVEASGRALSETALEKVSLSRSAFGKLRQQGESDNEAGWRSLWPDPVS